MNKLLHFFNHVVLCVIALTTSAPTLQWSPNLPYRATPLETIGNRTKFKFLWSSTSSCHFLRILASMLALRKSAVPKHRRYFKKRHLTATAVRHPTSTCFIVLLHFRCCFRTTKPLRLPAVRTSEKSNEVLRFGSWPKLILSLFGRASSRS